MQVTCTRHGMLLGSVTKCCVHARSLAVPVDTVARAFVWTSPGGTVTPDADRHTLHASDDPVCVSFHFTAVPASGALLSVAVAGSPAVTLSGPPLVHMQASANDALGTAKQLVYTRQMDRAAHVLNVHCVARACTRQALALRAGVSVVC